MREDARKIEYETLELLGNTVLFTCLRIDRATVPEGLHAYDVRHDDDCTGIMCEIAPNVLVNHWGTVLSREPIELTDNGRRFITEDDYSYLGDEMSLSDYMNTEPKMDAETIAIRQREIDKAIATMQRRLKRTDLTPEQRQSLQESLEFLQSDDAEHIEITEEAMEAFRAKKAQEREKECVQ